MKRARVSSPSSFWLACTCLGAFVACQPTGSGTSGPPPNGDPGTRPPNGDPGTPPPGNIPTCPTDPGALPEEHGDTITADQTWGPGTHLVKYDISVRAGATLTIAPCAVVRMRANTGLDVWNGGTLVAEGTMTQRIRFERELPGTTWRPIHISGTARLAYLTVTGGGDVGNDPASAALWLRADGMEQTAQPVARVAHVKIVDAPKFGVRLEGRATFTPDSEDLTVTGAGQFPVLTAPGGIGSLPSGDYTGNSNDEVLIWGGDIQWDMTLRDRGVPYHVGRPGTTDASLRVSGLAVPLLIIDPGVVLRFEQHADLEIEHFTGSGPASGALQVLGTSERPVLFTSAADAPASGDWLGIWFGSVPDPRNLIDYARVEYAGANASAQNHSCANPATPDWNSDRAAVLIMGRPASAFITNTTIAHSAADGIQRGWLGPEVDFLATNSFEDVAWCSQSFPKPETGSCPSPVPCPR